MPIQSPRDSKLGGVRVCESERTRTFTTLAWHLQGGTRGTIEVSQVFIIFFNVAKDHKSKSYTYAQLMVINADEKSISVKTPACLHFLLLLRTTLNVT